MAGAGFTPPYCASYRSSAAPLDEPNSASPENTFDTTLLQVEAATTVNKGRARKKQTSIQSLSLDQRLDPVQN